MTEQEWSQLRNFISASGMTYDDVMNNFKAVTAVKQLNQMGYGALPLSHAIRNHQNPPDELPEPYRD